MFQGKRATVLRVSAPLAMVGGAGLVMAAAQCSGSSGNNGASGAASLVAVTPVGPGAQCPAGGYQVQAGVDTNGNGVLDSGEVQTTQYVCNGAPGEGGAPEQVTVTPIGPGPQCPAGGYEVQVGSSTSYVCNGATPVVDASTGPQAVAVAAGGGHTCALLSDGSVWCWGTNNAGGSGPNGGNVSCPGLFVGQCTLAPVPVPLPHAATAIAAGEGETNCALLSDGSVWCWGDNSQGVLGTTAVPVGGNSHSATPVQVQLPASNPAIAVTVGYDHACALLKDSSTWCWGSASAGQLGPANTASSPVPVNSGLAFPFVAIAAGYQYTCGLAPAVQHGGNIDCWGNGSSGQFAASFFGANEIAMGVGAGHVCVILPVGGNTGQDAPFGAAGTVMCLGDNSEGALGIGNTAPENSNDVFTPVSFLASATQLSAGAETSCAIVTPGGSVACWGENDQGALGNGTTTNSSVPVWVEGLSDVTALAAGGIPTLNGTQQQGPTFNHTCAISHAQLWCWGDNTFAELGNGTAVSSSTPVLVAFGPPSSAGAADASVDAPAEAAPAPDGGHSFADGWQCASEADCTGDAGLQGWACCVENSVGTCLPALAFGAITCADAGGTLCDDVDGGDNTYCYGTTGGSLQTCVSVDASAPTTNDAGVPLFECQ